MGTLIGIIAFVIATILYIRGTFRDWDDEYELKKRVAENEKKKEDEQNSIYSPPY